MNWEFKRWIIWSVWSGVSLGLSFWAVKKQEKILTLVGVTMKLNVVFMLLCIMAMAGCSRNIIMNVDGMPISSHEYHLTNQETKIRTVFVLTEYQREYEDKEYIIKPRYLNALAMNEIDPIDVEQLILHIKVINIEKAQYSIHWVINEPGKSDKAGLIYSGRLSRKDFTLKLPFDNPGNYVYSFRLEDKNGDDLYGLSEMQYKIKGGDMFDTNM